MKSNLKRTLSFVLVLVMLFQLLPLQCFATEKQSAAVEEAAEETESMPVSVLGEVEALREEDTKHFRLSDGTYVAVAYGMPVHYEDENGEWKDIDNTLVRAETSGAYNIENEQMSVNFSAALGNGDIFTTARKGTSVTMSVLDTEQSLQLAAVQAEQNLTANAAADESRLDLSMAAAEKITYSRTAEAEIVMDTESVLTLEEKDWDIHDVIPEKLQSSLLYENVFPGADLMYTAFGYNIKEQIIVKEKQDTYRYDFLLTLDGLSALEKEDGSISLLNDQQEEVYRIPAPYMEDTAGERSYDVDYAVTETARGIVLTVTANADWINQENRVFPVMIDPTITITGDSDTADIVSTYTSEGNPTTSYNDKRFLYVGKNGSAAEFRSFVQFNNLPSLPDNSQITDVTFTLKQNRYNSKNYGELPICAYPVSSSASLSGMTWNSMPAYSTTELPDFQLGRSGAAYLSWNLTALAQDWYRNGTASPVICLVMANGLTMDTTHYANVEMYSERGSTMPVLTVSYRSNAGIESYFTYNAMSAGRAGTAYVADATGQLKVANTVLTYASTANPFALELVYNSDYFQKNANAAHQPANVLGLNMCMGSGWTLNVVQKIEEVTLGGKTCLKYRDGDGTDHYFYRKENSTDTAYYDEDGLGLKIQVTGTAAYTMSDDSGNSWAFTNAFLSSVTDSDGNKQLISYNANAQILGVVMQNNGKSQVAVTSFEYNGNQLTAVNDAAGNRYVFTYGNNGQTLQSITMQYVKNGVSGSKVLAEYTYSGMRLSGMKDVESGYSLEFTYNSDGKVSYYQEKSGNSVGTKVSVTYEGSQKTSYKNEDNNLYTHYLFDYAGRTVNAYSTSEETKILGATNAVYQEKTSQTDKSANRITQTASIGMAAQQLMHNGGMEDTQHWVPHGGGTVVNDPSHARTGNRVFKGTITGGSSYADNHILSANLSNQKTYTFSAYVNTEEMTSFDGNGIYLQVVKGEWVKYSNEVDYATADCVNGGWVRLFVTFTPETSGVHTLCICGTGASGTFYADDAQLEEAEAPSNVNLLENGSLQLGNTGWILGSNASYSTVGEVSPSSIQINGDYVSTDASAAYQVVNVNLPGDQTYVLSGWVKARAMTDNLDTVAAEQDRNKQCGLRAILTYSDGTLEYHYAPFDADIQNKWQFVSIPVVPKQPTKTVSTIQVICAYEKNANTAYFDDISLVREMAQTMVYEDGKLRSVTATDLDTESYNYDGNNNLIKMVTGGSGTFNYTYDTTYKHRLTSVTNGQITQSMTYDGVGNTTSSRLSNGSDGRYIETAATYAADGNRALSVTDATGATTSYNYGSGNTVMWNLPVSVTDVNGTVTASEYDEVGRVTKTGIANTAWLWYTYNKGVLSQVRRDTNVTQYYNLAYDDFGNMTSVKVGSKTLATYEYDSRNRLVKQTYGNGQAVTFTYDAYDRIKTATYPDGRILTYSYNGDGAVHSMVEKNGDSPASYVYEYDSLGRLITSEKLEKQFELGKSLMYNSQGYDENNRLVFESWKYPDDLTFANRYGYDDNNGTMVGIDIRNDHATLTYDSLLRLSTFNTGGVGSKNYTYREITSGAKNTNQVTQLSYPSLKNGYHFKYGYDQAGNISSYELTCAAGASYSEAAFSYVYDNQGQLLQATDGTETYTYTYDGAGNILTSNKKGTAHSYTYGDSNWRDLLTAYDGQTISYDGAGNPTSYYNGTRWTFTWGNGRRLETASGNGNTVSYAYDANGLRTSKTVNGVVHTYYYSGGLLRRETYGDTVLDFFYDANGTPYSMLQNRGAMYYYITNLQGDVIRLVNSSGQTAAYYEYDPYGNAIKAAGSHCEINPLRYRGYIYDTETGLYYCQSRYYDPEIGRFISADTYTSTGQGIIGNNMFAYCGSSPTNGVDASGHDYEAFERDLAAGSGGMAIPLIPAFFAPPETKEESKTTTLSKTRDDNDDTYTVYFLKDASNATDGIIYVGRVKTKYFKARMRYHRSKGRKEAYHIDQLTYVQCRFLEQAGMIYHHSIRKGDALYNQIRGISEKNGPQYVQAVIDFAVSNTYEDNIYLPESYILNQYENWLLNMGP